MTITIKSASKQALLDAGVPRAKIRLDGHFYIAEFEANDAKEVVAALKRGRK